MTTMAIRAAQFAMRSHAGQLRKYSREDYVNHPLRVAGTVSLFPAADDRLVAAAWLHDTIEDCGVSHEQLADEFGLYTADIVLELTNPSKQHSHLPRAERKAMDFAAIAKASVQARAIKLVDRLDNLKSLPIPVPSGDAGYYSKLIGESLDLIEAATTNGIGPDYNEEGVLNSLRKRIRELRDAAEKA